jgi:hypothetical protein
MMLIVGGVSQLFSPCFCSVDVHEEFSSRRASRERGVERHGRAVSDAVPLAPRPWSLGQTVFGEVPEMFPANRDST